MRAAKRVAIWLAAIVGVVSVLVGAVAVALARIQPDDVNRFLAESTRELSGRGLTFRGETELTLLPSPTLIFENAAFDNAPWSDTPDMVRVRRVEASLSWLPLLRGEFRITRLLLVEPEVHLETNAKGADNWLLGRGNDDERTPAALPPGIALGVSQVRVVNGRVRYRDARSGDAWEITVEEVTAHGDVAEAPLVLHGRAAYEGRPFEVAAKVGELGALLRNEPYDMQLALLAAGAAFRANGVIERPLDGAGWWMNVSYEIPSIASLTEFFSARAPYALPLNGTAELTDVRGRLRLDKIDAAVTLGDGKMLARGSLDDLLRMRGFELSLDITTRSLVSVAELAGVKLPAGGPVRATAKVTEDPKSGRLRVAELAADVALDGREGRAKLALSGAVADLGRLRGVDLRVSVSADSLRRLSSFARARLPGVGPVNVKARMLRDKRAWRFVDLKGVIGKSDVTGKLTIVSAGKRPRVTGRISAGLLDVDEFTGHRPAALGDRLFSNERWPVGALDLADVELELRAGRLRVHALALERARVKVRLHDRRLDLSPEMKLAGGDFSGDVRIDAVERGAHVAMRIEGKDFDLGQLSAQLGRRRLMEGGRSELDVDVRGQGGSLRELMAGLNGEMRLVASNARIRKEDLREAGGDLASEVLGGSDERKAATQLHCAVVQLSIEDGIASIDRSIALETDQALVSASGSIDLGTEALDMGVNVNTRGGIRISGASLSNMVRVGGTIASPSVHANAAGIAGAAATVAGAVASGGISLLAQGVIGSLLSDSSPCRTAMQRGSGSRDGVVPAGGGVPMRRTAESGS